MLIRDAVAILPGIVLCGLVAGWMVSIAGVDFITQENLVIWPTSYFMKTFGKFWLAQNGFEISLPVFREVLYRSVPLSFAVSAAYCVLWWRRSDRRSMLLKVLFVVIVIAYFVRIVYPTYLPPLRLELTLSSIFFPSDMVLYVIVAAVIYWWYFWRQTRAAIRCSPAVPLLLTFSGLLAFRILTRMMPEGYSIFYNGPVVLSFLPLMGMIIPRAGRSRRSVFAGELVMCLACLAPVALHTRAVELTAKDFVPLKTDRGTVRTSKHLAANYEAAIQFMKEKASLGQTVLSIPEDTSLFFLSGTYCPTRMFSFTPGTLAPGKMTDDTIREIDRKQVNYLLWSNRSFNEYRVPVFGKDFDREIGDYLKTHYHPVGPLIPIRDSIWDWRADVWERNSESGLK